MKKIYLIGLYLVVIIIYSNCNTDLKTNMWCDNSQQQTHQPEADGSAPLLHEIQEGHTAVTANASHSSSNPPPHKKLNISIIQEPKIALERPLALGWLALDTLFDVLQIGSTHAEKGIQGVLFGEYGPIVFLVFVWLSLT